MDYKNSVLKIIKENIDLIEKNDFDSLYQAVADEYLDPRVVGMLSTILIQSGIDPLEVAKPVENMFFECENLTAATIPNTVAHLPKAMFSASALKNIVLGPSIDSIDDRVFMYCDDLTFADLSRTHIKYLFFMTFTDCSKLETVLLPDTLEYIYSLNFSGCESLSNIILPDSLKSIGEQAFHKCTELKELNIPQSLNKIKKRAFSLSGITRLNYGGTKAQWRDIVKEREWHASSAISEIHCSDGVIKIKVT